MEKIKNIKLPNGEVYELGGSGLDDKITNCITEIPQRIKYTLENGTLTIKAGSVVIVPYGTTDRTSEFPVGATFINDNFKVYDTCYADGKFFVWAEIVEDIVRPPTSSTSAYTRFLSISITINDTGAYINGISGSGAFDTSDSMKTLTYYRTDTNIVNFIDSAVISQSIVSLPIMLVESNLTYHVASIKQIFNGFGYIGSTVWVDKGVKGLIPNGRNEDGTLSNKEIATNKLILMPLSSTDTNATVAVRGDLSTLSYYTTYKYDDTNNYNTTSAGLWDAMPFGTCDMTSGVISNFNPKLPFKAVDYSEALISPKGFTTSYNVSSGWVAPTNGLVYVQGYSNSKGAVSAAYINDRTVYYNAQSGSNANHHVIAIAVPICKGQTFTYSGLEAARFYQYG